MQRGRRESGMAKGGRVMRVEGDKGVGRGSPLRIAGRCHHSTAASCA